MRRTLRLLVAALAIGLTLAACGAKHDATAPGSAHDQSLSLELDAAPDADHAGIYAAQSQGDFAAAGLKVAIHTPGRGGDPLRDVETGRVDVAIVDEPQLMLARNLDRTVLGFGALVQHPLSSLIALRSRHISSPRALRGRTVGTTGTPWVRAELATVLARAHVPRQSVRVLDVGSDVVGAMLSGRVAATIGGYWNREAIELRHDHRRIAVTPVGDAGVPNYDELVFVTSETFFAQNETTLRRFVQAVGRGAAQVRRDPEVGVSALTGADPSLDRSELRTSVAATIPASFPSGGRPWGWQDQEEWNMFGRWMQRARLVSGPEAYVVVSTNQLLAGQGP